MTDLLAKRIIDAVPEQRLSILDLRPSEPALSARDSLTFVDRLEELSELVGRGFLALGATPDQLRPPEENPGLAGDDPQ